MRSICAVPAPAMTSSRKRSWRCSGNAGAPMRRDKTVAGYLFGIARHVVLQRLGSKYEPLADSGDDDVSEVASGALTALDNLHPRGNDCRGASGGPVAAAGLPRGGGAVRPAGNGVRGRRGRPAVSDRYRPIAAIARARPARHQARRRAFDSQRQEAMT